jgi:hypothetical protein
VSHQLGPPRAQPEALELLDHLDPAGPDDGPDDGLGDAPRAPPLIIELCSRFIKSFADRCTMAPSNGLLAPLDRLLGVCFRLDRQL